MIRVGFGVDRDQEIEEIILDLNDDEEDEDEASETDEQEYDFSGNEEADDS